MSYTIKNLLQVDDAAAKHGFSDIGQARFARTDLNAEQTGLAHHKLHPNKRQGFAHRHDQAEEINVVISGAGEVKLDDEIVEIKSLDAIRIAPGVIRQFQAGPDGLEWLVFGPHYDSDGEIIREGFWED